MEVQLCAQHFLLSVNENNFLRISSRTGLKNETVSLRLNNPSETIQV